MIRHTSTGLATDRCGILRAIARELASGQAALSASTLVALELQRALDDPDCTLDQAARLIGAEPLLAARVVAVANTVAYRPSGGPVAGLRQATLRLGMRLLRALVVGVTTRELAAPATERDRQLVSQLWDHTAHVAALAHALARRVTRLDAETALFAGIVHEVDGFYLLSRSRDYPELFVGRCEDDLASVGDAGEAEVGRAILARLSVPPEITQASEACWTGFLALPPESLGDTLLLADALAPVESPLRPSCASAQSRAAATIELMVGGDTLSEILVESASEVRSLADALRV